MSYLLDTNVISELRKGSRCNRGVSTWFDELADDEIFLSVLTLGEIRKGIGLTSRRDPTAAAALTGWLAGLVAAYGDRILPIDLEVAEEWGSLNVPDPLPVVDGLLAATARVHDLTLATRNARDIERTGAAFFNPFRE